ncbi:MAG: RNA 2',3'-cyclic phosphodiesterase [Methylococcaceae bacterium]|nr:RNA 2',3'-cyclic phosphodiesterase [Methylococcaceae bacterium]
MKRLFFALWPDDAIRRQCLDVVNKLSGEGLRPVAPKNLHVTLLFLGNIDAEQQAGISAAADRLSVPPVMELTFDRLGFWKKPAIYCLTARRFDSEIAVLVEQLAAIAVGYGVRIDERPFKPHITLARKAKASVVIEFEPIIWRADAFCQVESCSDKDGVVYRVIKRWSSAPSGLDTFSSN